jgi:glucose/arabinose dehydrogenase
MAKRLAILTLLGALLIGLWIRFRTRTAPSREANPNYSPFTDFRGEAPGTIHRIRVGDLPPPDASESVSNLPHKVTRPPNAWPQAPDGFKVELYASDLDNPRLIRTAPNGDVFVAESGPGRILVLRGISPDGRVQTSSVFAEGLKQPFGINFYPPGPDPKYVYVANTGSVVRFPYRKDDLKANGTPEVVVGSIPAGGRLTGGGHWTRDVVFSRDGAKMYVSVGSRFNISNTYLNPLEFHRADILEFNSDGTGLRVYATGLRNAVGIAVNPETGELWASVNERDKIGNNVPPDYITHIQENGFYGWPWYYIGGHEDPRLRGKHPELASKVIIPDVLLQPHNASLEITFYQAKQFPARFRGSIFAAEHGSWNRSSRTGYEVIFVPLKDGRATGEYEDFVSGFVTPDGDVWGRPVGVAVAVDGSLLISDDSSDSIWRVSCTSKCASRW